MSHLHDIEKAKLSNLGQILLRTARYYNEICVSRFQEFEPRFTLAHTRFIPYIDIEGGTRPSELAKRSGMSKQAMNLLLNELEDMGMIRREPCPDDGRAKLVFVTDQGHQYMLKGLGVFKDLEAEISRFVAEEDIESTKKTLGRVLTYLESL